MPPIFVYLMALMAYIAFACAVWAIAGALVIPQSTRALGKRIALSMAGSFPGVFFFQLLSAPAAGLILLCVGGIIWAFQPTGGLEFVLFVALFLGTVGLVAIASFLGFYTGWRIVWEATAGRSVREFLVNDPIVGPVVRFLRKNVPIVESVF